MWQWVPVGYFFPFPQVASTSWFQQFQSGFFCFKKVIQSGFKLDCNHGTSSLEVLTLLSDLLPNNCKPYVIHVCWSRIDLRVPILMPTRSGVAGDGGIIKHCMNVKSSWDRILVPQTNWTQIECALKIEIFKTWDQYNRNRYIHILYGHYISKFLQKQLYSGARGYISAKNCSPPIAEGNQSESKTPRLWGTFMYTQYPTNSPAPKDE